MTVNSPGPSAVTWTPADLSDAAPRETPATSVNGRISVSARAYAAMRYGAFGHESQGGPGLRNGHGITSRTGRDDVRTNVAIAAATLAFS